MAQRKKSIKTKVNAPRSMFERLHEDIFGSVKIKPTNFTFATQDPDEEIYILTRKDIITNFGWVVRFAFFTTLPFFFGTLFTALNFDLTEIVQPRFLWTFGLFYYSAWFTYAIIEFNDWYYDTFIVTNKRIVHYIYNPIVRYKVSEAELYNIQDVSESVLGVIPSVFDYGDLLIQTASQKNKFRIEKLPEITELRDIIVDLTRLARE